MSLGTRYRVYITPVYSGMVYADEREITDYVRIDGLPNISRGIDSGDYEFGNYTYDDLSLIAINTNGIFSDASDSRSMFETTRDLSKIRVEFLDYLDEVTTVFKGLINDEATRFNAVGDEITFRVLSIDSVIKKTEVPAGLIESGDLVSQALFKMLSVPKISNVLTVLEANINPDLDFTIDDGEFFNGMNTREAANKLMLFSNSIMLIDSDENVIIQSRTHNLNAVHTFYGPYDIKYRQNIISLNAYNTGLHRNFTSIKVNSEQAQVDAYVETFGFRNKNFIAEFVNENETEAMIADRLMNEFKVPKIELNIEVPTRIARDVQLLDRVSLDWSLRIKPIDGTFLPIVGMAEIGDPETPLPDNFGSLVIDRNLCFKVIHITENPSDFYTILKLRQIGTEINDGVINEPTNCLVGFAIIGFAIICEGGDPCDYFEDSHVGSAMVGCTLVA